MQLLYAFAGVNSRSVVIVALFGLILLATISVGAFLWFQKKSRKRTIHNPQEPIFPGPTRSNSSGSLFFELRKDLKKAGQIDAGIKTSYVELKNGQQLILYTFTDPADSFLSSYEIGKQVHLTSWLKYPGEQNQELGRTYLRLQKCALQDVVTGDLKEKSVLEILKFEINSESPLIIDQSIDVMLKVLENLASEFKISEIKGEINERLKDGFQQHKYHIIEEALGRVQVSKLTSKLK